jgi:vacuolar protein sorting-associated protein 35
MKDAFLLYEIEISDSKAQVRCLSAVIGTLLNCKNFSDEDYEALITKAAQYANKLLRKPDQSRMVVLCSHLFSHPNRVKAPSLSSDGDTAAAATEGTERSPYNDPDRVLECMQRALKVASVSNANIFVEILDRYVLSDEKYLNPVSCHVMSCHVMSLLLWK